MNSTKFCPICGQPIKEDAIVCPACGSTIKRETADTAVPAADKGSKSKKGLVIAICSAGAAVLIVLGLLLTLSGKSTAPTAPEQDQENVCHYAGDTEMATVEPKVAEVETAETASAVSSNTVYACSYDGFVAIRDKPAGEKLGELRNGPDGAELIGRSGDWLLIRFHGLEGYVHSKYVQAEPTISYVGKADIMWLKGVWGNSGYVLIIYDNGTFEFGYDHSCSVGKYIMQNNEVVFKTIFRTDESLEAFNDVLGINMADGKLGDYKKIEFLEEGTSTEGLDFGYMSKRDYRHRKTAVEQVLNR